MIPKDALAKIKSDAYAGVRARNPNKPPGFWKVRDKQFERQFGSYTKYLEKWVAHPPKNDKVRARGPANFYGWLTTWKAAQDARSGGGLKGKIQRAVATPLAGPASFLGANVATVLGQAIGGIVPGVGTVVGGALQTAAAGLPAATHGLQATTKQGLQALGTEAAIYGAVLAPLAPAIVPTVLGAAGSIASGLGAAAPPDAPPPTPRAPQTPLWVWIGLGVLAFLAAAL